MSQRKWEIKKLGELTLQELKGLIGYKDQALVPFSSKPLSQVYIVSSPVQGEYLADILDKEGIPCLFQSYRDGALDGIFTPSRGAGAIITLQEDSQRAATIIESVIDTMAKELEVEAENEEIDEDKTW